MYMYNYIRNNDFMYIIKLHVTLAENYCKTIKFTCQKSY